MPAAADSQWESESAALPSLSGDEPGGTSTLWRRERRQKICSPVSGLMLLNCENVGVNDDFFSWAYIRWLLARIALAHSGRVAVELPLRSLFEAPTVSGMAEKIETARRSSEASADLPIAAVSRAGTLPLSFAQERLWFFDQIEPGSAAYNIPRTLRLKGPLGYQRFAKRPQRHRRAARGVTQQISHMTWDGRALSLATVIAV